MKHRLLLAAVVATGLVGLSACASTPRSDAPTALALASAHPDPPAGDVVAQGTVMDAGGTVELCLGAIAESYPPQCSGIPIEGWSWDGIDGFESSGDVTWGAYAVQGAYDGATFTPTQPPIPLALYDPMPIEDRNLEVGDTPESTLTAIQDILPRALGPDLLSSAPQDGRLWVDVAWDDGTLQDAADEDFGVGVLVIRSAMNPV